MNREERDAVFGIVEGALIAINSARIALLDLQVRLRAHKVIEGALKPRYEGPAGEPRLVFDPEAKRQRIRDNVIYRLEHGSELLPDHGGHLPDFTLDLEDPEPEPGKPL